LQTILQYSTVPIENALLSMNDISKSDIKNFSKGRRQLNSLPIIVFTCFGSNLSSLSW